MKKFLCSIILMFMCAVTIFSGCNLVQTNSNKLADAVCVSVGKDVTVTRRELVNYYVSLSNQGYSYDIEELLEELLNQKLIIKEVKSNFKTYIEAIGEQLENESGTSLKDMKNKYYYNTAIKSVYDYIDNKILENENTIRAAQGLTLIEDETTADAKTDYDKESLYESSVEIDDNGKIVVKQESADFEDTLIGTSENNYGYDYTSIDHGNKTIRAQAYDRFIKQLIRNEKGKNLDTNEKNVLNREIERVYKLYEEQQYLDFFQQKYNRELPLDNSAVVERYKQLVLNSYSTFMLEGDNAYSTYVTAMQDDASKVYYHPYSSKTDGKGFIKVAHILIRFTDEQLTDTENDSYLSYKEIMDIEDVTERQNALNEWKLNCSGKARYSNDDESKDSKHLAGNEYGENIDYMTIYEEIKSALEGKTLQEKAEIFNDLMYKYSQDTGSLNSSTYYSVSIDTNIDESWVEAFADTARQIYAENGEGSLSEPVYVNNVSFDDDGNVTSGTYAGYHIILVLDEYSNLCEINSVDSLDEDFAYTLLNTRAKLGVEEKSLYDVVYDDLTLNNYSDYRQSFIDTAKAQLKANNITIDYNKKAYEDLISD